MAPVQSFCLEKGGSDTEDDPGMASSSVSESFMKKLGKVVNINEMDEQEALMEFLR